MASVSSSSSKLACELSRKRVGRVAAEEEADPLAPSADSSTKNRRDVLIRQPSYCKILSDLKGTEQRVANMKREPNMAGEVSTSEDGGVAADEESSDSSSPTRTAAAAAAPSSGVQTISINGQQYQIVSPSAEALQTVTVGGGVTPQAAASTGGGGGSGAVIQYAPVSQNGQTVFIPGTVSGTAGIAVGSSAGHHLLAGEESTRKREIRLLKNREAARECRNKKKEYIKCLENRVAVLENQNKALIEELKSLKELYTGHKG